MGFVGTWIDIVASALYDTPVQACKLSELFNFEADITQQASSITMPTHRNERVGRWFGKS
jgi:hypothetical protein